MSNEWRIGSEEYEQALQQEGEYWGHESEKAFSQGIPFSADMRRAQRLQVDRGAGLPQQQVYDPAAERIMNGDLYQLLFDRVAAVSPHSRVLVLACGPGGLALELARQGHHVHAIDISRGAIALAERMAEENPFTENFGSLRYTVADLNRIELEKERYEAVVAWDGLHHILALDRLMQQIRSGLAPTGVFIFSDNVGMSFLSRLIGGALYFILPTHVPYRVKLGFALGGKKKIKEEMTRRSPFEEVSSGSILEAVGRHFTLQWRKSHTGIGFRAALAGDLRGPDQRRHLFLRWLKKLDDWAVDHGLLKGDHVLAIAVPRKD
ncbi:MAG TPA: class I SAM-dependent methyltransferase [bacterium]|nr:class I SAM-dependent methyltransferase [bacterium]